MTYGTPTPAADVARRVVDDQGNRHVAATLAAVTHVLIESGVTSDAHLAELVERYARQLNAAAQGVARAGKGPSQSSARARRR